MSHVSTFYPYPGSYQQYYTVTNSDMSDSRRDGGGSKLTNGPADELVDPFTYTPKFSKWNYLMVSL